MSVVHYLWKKKIYFSNKTGLFIFGNKKKIFLTTHSLNSMTHQDGDYDIACKMSWRLE